MIGHLEAFLASVPVEWIKAVADAVSKASPLQLHDPFLRLDPHKAALADFLASRRSLIDDLYEVAERRTKK